MSDAFDPDRETDRAVVIDDPRTLVCESPDAVRLMQDSGGFVPESVDIPRRDLPRVIEHLEAALDGDGEGVLIPDGGVEVDWDRRIGALEVVDSVAFDGPADCEYWVGYPESRYCDNDAEHILVLDSEYEETPRNILSCTSCKVLVEDGGRTADAERLANAEPPHVPADAPRDANGDPVFETTETLISEAPGDVCRTLGDSMRLEAVQLVAGAAARTDGRLTLCALANQLAGCAAVEETDVEILKQTLHHNHLPALHRANALHYDGEENIIETTLETASYARLAKLVTGFVEGDSR